GSGPRWWPRDLHRRLTRERLPWPIALDGSEPLAHRTQRLSARECEEHLISERSGRQHHNRWINLFQSHHHGGEHILAAAHVEDVHHQEAIVAHAADEAEELDRGQIERHVASAVIEIHVNQVVSATVALEPRASVRD